MERQRDARGKFMAANNDVAEVFLEKRTKNTESPEVAQLLNELDLLCDQYSDAVNDSNALDVEHLQRAQDIMDDALGRIMDTSMQDPIAKSELLIHIAGTMTTHLDDQEGSGAKRAVRHEMLPSVLGANLYTRCSKELAAALNDGPVSLEDLETSDTTAQAGMSLLSHLPTNTRNEIIERFRDLSLTDVNTNGEIVFGTNKRAAKYLATGAVETARLVSRIFSTEVPRAVASADDIRAAYDEHNGKRQVAQLEVRSETKAVRILPINELRLGHQDARAGFELVDSVIDMIRELPDDEKPHVIVVSNLIQGGFNHTQAARKAANVEGLMDNNRQFQAAKVVLDRLHELGIPVILSLGKDDHKIAKDYTIDVIREMNGIARTAGKENFVNYKQINDIGFDARFPAHQQFQLEYVMPLCYKMGRRLRTAEEVAQATGGELTISEYLMIYDYVRYGTPLPPECGIDPEAVVAAGEWRDGMCVVDDFNLTLTTDEQEREVWYRHVMNYTPDVLLANHVAVLEKMLGQAGTNEERRPDMLMTGSAQESVYMTKNNVVAQVLPGLADPLASMQRNQYSRVVTGDPSHRMTMLRKRWGAPALTEIEYRDSGELVHTYINKDLMDRADSLPRTAVFELCDFQVGSPTARLDYQVKYLSYMLEVAKQMPVAVQFAGDIIHGHIYPGFSDESQAQGLIRIKSQKEMVKQIIYGTFHLAPKELKDAFIDVLVQQGNHDEVQRTRVPNNNDSNIDYLVDAMRDVLDEPNPYKENIFQPQESRVRHNAIFHTESGTPVPTWMGTTHLGAYTIKTAHYHLDRGAKGNTGGLPVYHAYQRAEGLGDEETSQIFVGAHWHNPQSALLGKKLVVVGGAMAEQSQFEDIRGYSARLAGNMILLGGKKPVQVVTVTKEALDTHGVRNGFFTKENLAEHGFFDDEGYDQRRHGIYSRDDLPKSAEAKMLKVMARRASQLAMFETTQQNPNLYDQDRNIIEANDATIRAYAAADRLSRGALSL